MTWEKETHYRFTSQKHLSQAFQLKIHNTKLYLQITILALAYYIRYPNHDLDQIYLTWHDLEIFHFPFHLTVYT